MSSICALANAAVELPEKDHPARRVIEAFKAGQIDFRTENIAKEWATAYDFPAVKSGAVAIVTSKFPSIQFMSAGAREAIKKRGLTEVLFLEWDFGNRDFGPIANRVKDAKPDFVWVGAIGLDGNLLLDAMKKIDYVPPQHFYLYPAPGPLVTLPEAKNALSVTIFEEHPPFTSAKGAADFIKMFKERGTAAKLPDVQTLREGRRAVLTPSARSAPASTCWREAGALSISSVYWPGCACSRVIRRTESR